MTTDRSDNHHTSDGVEITPGLWVWNNNLDSVQIDPAQFVNPSLTTGIGGIHWDGWYNTLNGDGKRSHSMNGTRMATVYDGIGAADYPGWSIAAVRDKLRNEAKQAASAHVRVTIDVYGDDDPAYLIALVKDHTDPRHSKWPAAYTAVVTNETILRGTR